MTAEKITQGTEGLNVPNEPIIHLLSVMELDRIFGRQQAEL